MYKIELTLSCLILFSGVNIFFTLSSSRTIYKPNDGKFLMISRKIFLSLILLSAALQIKLWVVFIFSSTGHTAELQT